MDVLDPADVGAMTVPPPALAEASIAFWKAAVSSVCPSPFAPKSRTLSMPGILCPHAVGLSSNKTRGSTAEANRRIA
jgi:hypothetical protein